MTTDWQPIETAPRLDFVDIWCSSPDGETEWRETNCWWHPAKSLWVNQHGQWDCATHWMPIPKAPNRVFVGTQKPGVEHG